MRQSRFQLLFAVKYFERQKPSSCRLKFFLFFSRFSAHIFAAAPPSHLPANDQRCARARARVRGAQMRYVVFPHRVLAATPHPNSKPTATVAARRRWRSARSERRRAAQSARAHFGAEQRSLSCRVASATTAMARLVWSLIRAPPSPPLRTTNSDECAQAKRLGPPVCAARCSLLAARCSPLAARRSPPPLYAKAACVRARARSLPLSLFLSHSFARLTVPAVAAAAAAATAAAAARRSLTHRRSPPPLAAATAARRRRRTPLVDACRPFFSRRFFVSASARDSLSPPAKPPPPPPSAAAFVVVVAVDVAVDVALVVTLALRSSFGLIFIASKMRLRESAATAVFICCGHFAAHFHSELFNKRRSKFLDFIVRIFIYSDRACARRKVAMSLARVFSSSVRKYAPARTLISS